MRNPDELRNVKLGDSSDYYIAYCQELIPKLVESGERAYQMVVSLMERIADSPLDGLRSSLRHELEHSNPDYRQITLELHQKRRRVAELVRCETTAIPDSDVGAYLADYLTEASAYVPLDEVRAHFCGLFDEHKETRDSLSRKSKDISSRLSQYNGNQFKFVIQNAVLAGYKTNMRMGNAVIDQETINHVANSFMEGAGYESFPIDMDRVDHALKNDLFTQMGYWHLRFLEGTRIAINQCMAFYADKIST